MDINGQLKKAQLEALSSNPTGAQGRVFFDTALKQAKVYDGVAWGALGGSGSGELNLVSSPSTATGWTAATGATLATTTTSGDLPLEGIVATAIKITSGTGTSAEATLAQTNSFSFTTPASYAVKTKVELWIRPGSNFIPNEWTVSVYAGSTRQALTTDASGVSYIPNAQGKYTTYFDAAASTAYTVRFTRVNNAGTNAGVLNVANVIVGPGIQPQGAVVGDWTKTTSVFTASVTPPTKGTIVTDALYWRRVGNSMEVRLEYQQSSGGAAGSGTYILNLPAGVTIDTTKLTGVGSSYTQTIGTFTIYDGTNRLTGMVNSATNLAANGITFTTTAGNTFGSTVNDFSNTVLRVGAYFTVPIAEWAGSGTVNLAHIDVFFVFNTGNVTAAGATDSTSFGYGPAGTPVLAIDSVSSSNSTTFVVQFQTPIQVGDKTELELSSDGGDTWVPWIYGFIRQGAYLHGARVVSNSSTSVLVQFMNGGYDSNLTTFGLAGEPWSNLSGYRWRVRKSSGGQAVGFGIVNPGTSSGLVAAAGLPGNTTGNAIAAGYVGQVLSGQNSAGLALTSGVIAELTTIVLTPGEWDLSGIIAFSGSATATSLLALEVATTTAGFGPATYDGTDIRMSASCNINVAQQMLVTPGIVPVRVSVNTTYYLNTQANFSGGTVTAKGTIYARRRA